MRRISGLIFISFGQNNVNASQIGSMIKPILIVGEQPLSIEDVVAVARQERNVALPETTEWRELIQRGADFLDQLLLDEGVIYGVTTGYGDSCLVEIPMHQVKKQ